MLTPSDITQQALNKYPLFVDSHFLGETFFPWDVRFGRADPGQSLSQLRQDIELLLSQSHAKTGPGYRVELAERRLRLHGPQQLPTRVWFDNETDYLSFIGKQQEFDQLRADVAAAVAESPEMGSWAKANARALLNRLSRGEGRALGLAVHALHERPRPDCYPREIPLPGISGKFIEGAIDLIADILKGINSPAWLPADDAHDALGLRIPPRLIRAMWLDGARLDYGQPVNRFARPEGVINVIAVENLRSFLTMPAMPATLAIWGEGRAAQTLSRISWLRQIRLFYWGDMDPHGFAILSALRAEFPEVRSVLMEEKNLDRYQALLARAEPLVAPQFEALTEAEAAAATKTQQLELGVEQEKLPPTDLAAALHAALDIV